MKRIALPIETAELCHYGCGNQAKFKNGSSNLMCCERSNSCPAIKKKNSDRGREAYKSGTRLPAKELYTMLSNDSKNNMAWSKGKTKNIDSRVARPLAKRRISDGDKLQKVLYQEQCSFRLAGIIERIDGFHLLKEYGMYHRITNKNGVVRDHIISVDYGYKNDIDPETISHPANCRFISHKDNARKSKRCDLTLVELVERIRLWDCEGNRHT